MKLHELKPAEGGKITRKRVGRGRATGSGKTSGRGQKGQKARSKTRPGFEGGQMPLIRRVPKLGGFKNPDRIRYELVNVGKLRDFKTNASVDPAALAEAGLIKKDNRKVKILGDGVIDKPLKVKAHAFTKTALEKIVEAGGSAEVL